MDREERGGAAEGMSAVTKDLQSLSAQTETGKTVYQVTQQE